MDKKELIFNMYKDSVIISKKFKNMLIEKYELNAKEADDIFIAINNYQIKKYGGRLEYDDRKKSRKYR